MSHMDRDNCPEYSLVLFQYLHQNIYIAKMTQKVYLLDRHNNRITHDIFTTNVP